MASTDARHTAYLGLTNGGERAITFILEPWASEFPMPPGVEWIVEVEGPLAHYYHLQVVHGPETLTVHAWDGSDARLWRRDGALLEFWTGIRVPIFGAPRTDLPKER